MAHGEDLMMKSKGHQVHEYFGQIQEKSMEQKEKGLTGIHESSHSNPLEFNHQPKGQMRSD